MNSQKERINNLIDMNDYFTRLFNDVELFNSILSGKTLEIPSLILQKEDALEFTKIIYDEIDSGIFKATIRIHPSQNSLVMDIGIAVNRELLSDLDKDGPKGLVQTGIKRIITKFKRKGIEILETERKYSD
jgi:hypothetical protein